MKLKMVLELETLEQVALILATVKPWNINVDVAPVFDKGTTKKTRRKPPGGRQITKISDPAIVVELTGTEPSSNLELFRKIKPKIKKPMTRKELAWVLSKEKKQSHTKATSTIVSKWIREGALNGKQDTA